jgi:hypothetical protein
MGHRWWWQERGEDVLLEEVVVGTAVCDVPLRNLRPDRNLEEPQGFLLVVTNLRLALMLQPEDDDARGEDFENSRASAPLQTFVPEHGAPRDGDSAWVNTRSKWDSLCGVWNVIPLGMILRVASSLDDGAQKSQTPGRSRMQGPENGGRSTPTLAPALPLVSAPAFPSTFLSPSETARGGAAGSPSLWMPAASNANTANKNGRWGMPVGRPAGAPGEAVVRIECYDLRRVDLFFETADAALRVLHLLRTQPFSPERFLHIQLREVVHDTILAGHSRLLVDNDYTVTREGPLGVQSKVGVEEFAFLLNGPDGPMPASEEVTQLVGQSLLSASSQEADFMHEICHVPPDVAEFWRVSYVNEDYLLCESYPRRLLVPASTSDSELLQAASFRTKGRIPVAEYIHTNGASISRSGQPKVGELIPNPQHHTLNKPQG